MKKKKTRQSPFGKSTRFITAHWFELSCIGIFVLAFCLRVFHFTVRWGLGNDDARDVAIALEALRRHELPQIGSFSSAGPFAFGPFFYWFIMAWYLVLPFFFTAPWIGMLLVSLLTVGVLMLVGYILEGKKFALLVGLFATVSPQLVARSLTLGQHSFIALFASLALLMLLVMYRHTKAWAALMFGFFIGAAINFHYQALNLAIFIPAVLFLPKISILRRAGLFLLSGLGVLIGLSPLLYWDSFQGFANTRNLLDYLLVGQYRLYVPNSWRLFLFSYMPSYWAFVIGGYRWVGLVAMLLSGITVIVLIIRRQLPRIWLYLLVPFAVLLFINRYYKGERSEGYLLYLLPLILLSSSYMLFVLWQKKERLLNFPWLLPSFAFVVLASLLIGDVIGLPGLLSYKSPVASFEKAINVLKQKYPGQKFSVYDYQDRLPYQSQPLGALLGKDNLIDSSGKPIGVICYIHCPVESFPLITSTNGIALVDLSKVKDLARQKKEWIRRNPSDMYDSLIGWSQKHELTATFSLQDYLLQKLHLR